MTTLLLTHGDRSNQRIERGLEPRGIDCVELDASGGRVDPSPARRADVGLVFPGRLVEGTYVDAVADLDWINDARDLLRSRNKAATGALLRDAGLDVPETRLLSDPVGDDDVLAAAEDLGYPLVVKQTCGTKGEGAVLVHDPDSLLGVADQYGVIQRSPVFDRTFLLQEYVQDARDVRAMVVDGTYVGAVERRREGWLKNVHRGADAVAIEPSERVVDVAERCAGTVGVGFAGVDLLVEDGGSVRPLEVNGKPTVDDPEKYEPEFFDTLARLVERVEER